MKQSIPAPATRLRAERQHVRESESSEPLRRRLLAALGDRDAKPSDLAKVVGARPESVSRKLKALRDEGMVAAEKSPDDGRHSIFSLTRDGRAELGRYLTFGRLDDPPPPATDGEKVEFLGEALEGARAMRRRSNRLREAIERLEDIRFQALELGAADLALQALADLTITQRQAREIDQRNRSLEIMKEIAFGAGGVESRLIFPAVAHLEYESGKGSDLGETDTAVLARHLIAATSMFGTLIDERPKAETKVWRSRQAWSVISLAGNFREQSRYEDALQYGSSALEMFKGLGDSYGQTRCWLLFGSCLRLLQQFDVAWTCLQHAVELARARGNSFERAMVECLFQMGEVRRCQSRTDEARELLDDAVARAERLDLHMFQAFATSARGATEFQEGDLERAPLTLRAAQKMFKGGGEVEGIALNARRQATVARHLSAEKMPFREKETKSLIRLAERNYDLLGSPAGVAACEIERGWLRWISPDCGDVKEVVSRLSLMLEDGDQRGSLEGDLWVPKVLREFSKRVGDPLEKEAKGLLTDANRKLQREGEKGVRSVSRVADGLREAPGERLRTAVVEMGGESRRRKAPLELTAAGG